MKYIKKVLICLVCILSISITSFAAASGEKFYLPFVSTAVDKFWFTEDYSSSELENEIIADYVERFAYSNVIPDADLETIAFQEYTVKTNYTIDESKIKNKVIYVSNDGVLHFLSIDDALAIYTYYDFSSQSNCGYVVLPPLSTSQNLTTGVSDFSNYKYYMVSNYSAIYNAKNQVFTSQPTFFSSSNKVNSAFSFSKNDSTSGELYPYWRQDFAKIIYCDLPIYNIGEINNTLSEGISLTDATAKPLVQEALNSDVKLTDCRPAMVQDKPVVPSSPDSQVYFKSLKIVPHYSSNVADTYWDFYYELSSYSLENIKNGKTFIDVDLSLLIGLDSSFDVLALNEYKVFKDIANKKINSKRSIKLDSSSSNHLRVNLSDFISFSDGTNDYSTGLNWWLDFGRDILGFLKDDFLYIDQEYIDMYVTLMVAQGSFTINDTSNFSVKKSRTEFFRFDFLSKNTSIASINDDGSVGVITEDKSGYSEDISIDDSGNEKKTYYYIDDDGNKKNITREEYDKNVFTVTNDSIINQGDTNVNVNITNNIPSSSGGDNVVIEDDDYNRDGLVQTLKDGYGIFDNTDTGEKGDGLIALFSDVYPYLGGLGGLTIFGVATVVGIGIIRMIFKR